MYNNLNATRLIDPVLTNIAQGYRNAEGVASFVAPAVNVDSRAGRTLVFGKESFAQLDLYRAPGAEIQRVSTGYTTRSYDLRQSAIGYEVTEEAARDAQAGGAAIDLRKHAAIDAAKRLMQSWEIEVAQSVLNRAAYENTNLFSVSAADKWDSVTADVEIQMDQYKEAVRKQIGAYPNKLLLSPEAYDALKRNKRIRSYLQRGTVVNEEVLAQLFDLDEVRVARRLRLDTATGNLVNIYSNMALLFFQPNAATDSLMPSDTATSGTPAFAYTYQLRNMPVVTPERFDVDRRVFRGDMLTERSVELVGLGSSDLVGSASLILAPSSFTY